MFVPDNFQVPKQINHPRFIARKLTIRDVYLDYLAVMSSVDTIQKTRGGDWPTIELTFEDDLIDLGWHQREFERKTSFAYTVMNLNETECLGCFYLYPPGTRAPVEDGADVDVSFWVTKKAYRDGLYPILYNRLDNWLKSKWPFKKVQYTNIKIP